MPPACLGVAEEVRYLGAGRRSTGGGPDGVVPWRPDGLREEGLGAGSLPRWGTRTGQANMGSASALEEHHRSGVQQKMVQQRMVSVGCAEMV